MTKVQKSFYKRLFVLFPIMCLILTLANTDVITAETPSVCQVSVGCEHSIVLKTDGSVWGFGNNDYGEMGNGTLGDGKYDTKDNYVLTPTFIINDIKEISAIGYHSLALKKDGTLWAWGYNGHGQVGIGSFNHQPKPVQILTDVISIARGHGLHSMAIKSDHTLWAWGWNQYGQLGDGTTANRNKPVMVMKDVKSAAVGYGYSMVIKTDGSLWAWGLNQFGPLGTGNKKNVTKPVKIMDGVKQVVTGQTESFALKTDGSLWGWGLNRDGNIGDGTKTQRLKPVKIMTEVKEIGGSLQIAAIKTDNSLWMWGPNNYGQYGSGQKASSLKPICVLKDVLTVSSNWGSTLAVKRDKTLWSTGFNNYGQLGIGSNKDINTFKLVMSLDQAVIKILINGSELHFSLPQITVNGTTLASVRTLAESLGATVSYDSATKEIVITKNQIDVRLKVNSNSVIKNDENIAVSAPITSLNGNTYAPVEFIAQTFSDSFKFDKATNTMELTVNSPQNIN